MGWRSALIIISVIMAIYIVFVLFRLQAMKREKEKNPEGNLASHQGAGAVIAHQGVRSAEDNGVAATGNAEEDRQGFALEPLEDPEIPIGRVEALERELVILRKDRKRLLALEEEISQFRKEVGGLRAEVMLLREQHEARSEAPVRNISPLYSDAMQMAMQGHDAESISQHCGISRAEADLVVAMVKPQD